MSLFNHVSFLSVYNTIVKATFYHRSKLQEFRDSRRNFCGERLLFVCSSDVAILH